MTMGCRPSDRGVVAAGVGLTVAGLGKSFVTYVSGQANYRIPYDLKAMGVFGVGCLVFILLGWGLTVPSIPAWTLRLAMLMSGVIVAWFILGAADRRAMATMAGSVMGTRVRRALR